MNKKIVQELNYTGEEQRLDLAVSESFGITRSKAQSIIKDESLLVNGKHAKAKDLAKTNDKFQILAEEEKTYVLPEILFEDDDILVVNKPSGLSVHQSAGEKDTTVVEIFSNKLKFSKDEERPGVVHRLDKGTSGVMVLAKNEKSLNALQKEFKNRNVKKTYLALVKGIIQPEEGTINMPILRDPTKKERMTVAKEGKEAVTYFQTINTYLGKYSLLELQPKTGRTHQIRVHLSALGYPIVGDYKYGQKDQLEIPRIFLHAKKLEFRHPRTEKFISFESELPAELEKFLAGLN